MELEKGENIIIKWSLSAYEVKNNPKIKEIITDFSQLIDVIDYIKNLNLKNKSSKVLIKSNDNSFLFLSNLSCFIICSTGFNRDKDNISMFICLNSSTTFSEIFSLVKDFIVLLFL